MHRKINQINVSITTNRGCNLRCEHCYIMPHVFKDPTRMTIKHAKLLFDRVEELIALDGNLEEVEWEAIGGETTMMPFEWWDEMLPYMLDRIERVNRGLKIPGSLNFLTNLMIRDDRYFDLFNHYADHPAFCLYTSWEPDTRRFGYRNKLFPKFLANMDRLRVPNLILDVIMTREVCELGGKYVADTFVPHGVTDFSCKMLSPFGSGKAFFDKAMVDFAAMSRFLAELDAAIPDGVTYTPSEEALSSLYRGTSFQCNGNFYYDLSVEPDGLTHFNANQTADERVDGGIEIRLEDPDWARKVVFGNTEEAAGKLGLKYPECHQCEYLRFCNAGWWHYKDDQDRVAPFRQEDCAGLKAHWDRKAAELQGSRIDVSDLNHRTALRDALTGRRAPQARAAGPHVVFEEDIADLDAFLAVRPDGGTIEMSARTILSRTPSERCIFYDALGIPCRINRDTALALSGEEAERILSWQTNQVLRRIAPLTPDAILGLVEAHPEMDAVRLLKDAAGLLAGLEAGAGRKAGTLASGMVVDARNDELFRWCLGNASLCARISRETGPLAADEGGAAWISRLVDRVAKERRAAGL